MFYFNPVQNNFTGIINIENLRPFTYLICFMWMLSLNYTLYPVLKHSLLLHIKKHMLILNICILITLFLPYQQPSSLQAQLHLLFALCAFIQLHYMLYYIKDLNIMITNFYIASEILAGGFVLTFSSITGISEWIFVIGLWISLTCLFYSYKKWYKEPMRLASLWNLHVSIFGKG